jgi:hypothetical protein
MELFQRARAILRSVCKASAMDSLISLLRSSAARIQLDAAMTNIERLRAVALTAELIDRRPPRKSKLHFGRVK